MAAIAYAEPAIYMPGQYIEPDSQPFPFGSNTILRGDILILSSNVMAEAASNAHANIVGMAEHGSADIYFTGIGGAAAVVDSALFGSTTATTALQPGQEINGVKVVMARNNQLFEVSLVQAWATNLIGTQAGLLLDSASGKYVADNSQANPCFNIVGKMDGPSRGTVGDTGARIIVYFLSSVLANI